MSLILPFTFFSSVNPNPPVVLGTAIFKIITTDVSSPYPDSNFIFGGISSINNISLTGIGLLDKFDEVDINFRPNLTNSAFSVRSAVISSGNAGDFKFIIGGNFNISGVPNTNRIAILNLSAIGGNLITSFTTTPPLGDVYGLIITDRVYAVGVFDLPRKNIIAYDFNGTSSTTFRWGLNSYARCIKSDSSGNIFVGGAFTTVTKVGVANYSRRGIAKINTSGSGTISTTFNPSKVLNTTGLIVNDIEITSIGDIIVASTNAGSNKALIRLPPETPDTAYESFDVWTGVIVYDCLAIKIDNNGKLLAGLRTINGFRLYRFNMLGSISLDTTFGSGDGYVSIVNSSGSNVFITISVDSQNNIILGGDFTSIDGNIRNKFAVLDNNGAVLNR